MRESPEFDEFYLDARQRLVLQTFALTGDLGAAERAVRDAFVSARANWRKVGRLDDPEGWVRPKAWNIAQRRHTARIWHREKDIDDVQRAVLDSLHSLTDVQRRALLLSYLTRLPMDRVSREIGETEERARNHLHAATVAFSAKLGCDASEIDVMLATLEPIAARAGLAAPARIGNSGRRQRRWRALVGTAAAAAVAVGSGYLVLEEDAAAGGIQTINHPVGQKQLLRPGQVQPLTAPQVWRADSTSDNTDGTGINSICQESRFADPKGERALVRKFSVASAPARALVQTIEESTSRTSAEAAYKTTVGWYAGCKRARLQLLNAYRITGLGDTAELLKLRVPDKQMRTYVVAVARTGVFTNSLVVETRSSRAPDVEKATDLLTAAVQNLCHRDGAGPCRVHPVVAPVLPPASGETPGMLAVADLPAVGTINKPWVGADPIPAQVNVASTTCDEADFLKGGAVSPLTRTFLIPQAPKLPRRFGITETYGDFRQQPNAKKFFNTIAGRMGDCEKRQLSSKVPTAVVVAKGYRGSSYALWRVENEINDRNEKVAYWMGIAQVGRYVAQVNFTPSGDADVDEETFRAMVTRARDRMFELAR